MLLVGDGCWWVWLRWAFGLCSFVVCGATLVNVDVDGLLQLDGCVVRCLPALLRAAAVAAEMAVVVVVVALLLRTATDMRRSASDEPAAADVGITLARRDFGVAGDAAAATKLLLGASGVAVVDEPETCARRLARVVGASMGGSVMTRPLLRTILMPPAMMGGAASGVTGEAAAAMNVACDWGADDCGGGVDIGVVGVGTVELWMTGVDVAYDLWTSNGVAGDDDNDDC